RFRWKSLQIGPAFPYPSFGCCTSFFQVTFTAFRCRSTEWAMTAGVEVFIAESKKDIARYALRSSAVCWWHLEMKCESYSARTLRANKFMHATCETHARDEWRYAGSSNAD